MVPKYVKNALWAVLNLCVQSAAGVFGIVTMPIVWPMVQIVKWTKVTDANDAWIAFGLYMILIPTSFAGVGIWLAVSGAKWALGG